MSEYINQMLEKCRIPNPEDALPGRDGPMAISGHHAVYGESFLRPLSAGEKEVLVGMGCFWGAERKFWQTEGVVLTAVGYGGGYTPNPNYEEVCSGKTAHTELVRVVFDTNKISLDGVLKVFWENHNPTQGLRQGNDIGSQYRSAIYWVDEEDADVIEASRAAYQALLLKAGHGMITTEIEEADLFFYAEEYHQQYLHKNPNGYCGLGGTGVSCPIGLAKST